MDISWADLDKTIDLIHKFIDEYNKGKPLKDRLRVNHSALMMELVEIYACSLIKQLELGAEPSQQSHPVFVSNAQIDKRMPCKPTTNRNIHKRLLKSGLILKKGLQSNVTFQLIFKEEISSALTEEVIETISCQEYQDRCYETSDLN